MVEHFPGEPKPVGGDGPRGFVGGLWHEMGELQFRFMFDQGLRPHQVFLDVACGSLRLGARIIPYLEQGNYLGIDIDQNLVEHGKMVELGQTWCELKKPEFVISDSFEFNAFSKVPDFALAQSLFTHLNAADIRLCLGNLSQRRHKGTVFYATFFEVDAPQVNPPQSHPHIGFSYTRAEMEAMGRDNGWRMDYIGHWNHPRDQRMIRYFPA